MLLSVIVPTHNRSAALAATLKKLSCQQFGEAWEVIVVNNNCADDTNAIVCAWQQEFSVPLRLIHEKKPGASAARNAGACIAEGKYLVFVDNDILTEPNFLQLHFRALQQNPNSWIIGQVVNLPEQENSAFAKFRKLFYPFISQTEKIRETDGITGQNVSMPREHFVKLGGFDENFQVASGEDHEFAMRARKQLGIKTLLAPNILVVHNDWAGWTFSDFCLRQRIYARTEFFFWQRYGDEHPRLLLVKENLPADWRKDSAKLLFRKQVKRFLGKDVSQKTLLSFCALLEHSHAPRRLLWRFYKLALAGAINRGFREGREDFLDKQSADYKG